MQKRSKNTNTTKDNLTKLKRSYNNSGNYEDEHPERNPDIGQKGKDKSSNASPAENIDKALDKINSIPNK